MPDSAFSSQQTRAITILFLIGLGLRLPGLLFNGVADIFQMILDWGFNVRALGLAKGFDINYGILSYAVFGVAAAVGEEIPRLWWAPYKLAAILFEIGVLGALLGIVGSDRKRPLIWMYWLNPWFILHGAYQGFWEGAYMLLGLMAVLVLGRVRNEKLAWRLAGSLLMASGMVKPQGLVHFAGPLALFLGVEFLRGRRVPLRSFLIGLAAVVLLTSLFIWFNGGSPLALPHNYGYAFTTMPNLSNGGPNGWRFFSYVYMTMIGQAGEVYNLRPPRLVVAALSGLAGVISLVIMLAFSLRVRLSGHDGHVAGSQGAARWSPFGVTAARHSPYYLSFLILTLGSLVMSQFGVRAHINHTYGATVLLIPLVLVNRGLLLWWVVMVAIQGVAHLAQYGLGTTALIPPDSAHVNYPYAGTLIARVKELSAYQSPDALLAFHEAANQALSTLASPSSISILSLVMFGCVCVIISKLFGAVQPGHLRF